MQDFREEKLLTLECEDGKILLVAKEQPFEMKKRWLTSRTRSDKMIEKLI